MIFIRNGKKYDTETAEQLCKEVMTENYYQNVLYKKRNCEFFITKEPYSGNTTIETFKNIDEVKAWCEANLSGEDYISIFGDVEE